MRRLLPVQHCQQMVANTCHKGYDIAMSKSVILERSFIPKDTLVMSEGDEGNSAYIIQSGSVEVYTENEGSKVELAHLDVGEIFGEMSLIFDGPRAASVRALEDCNLIVITRESFKYKLSKTDPTIKAIMQMLTQRIVTANNTLVNSKSSSEDLETTTQIIYQNMLSALPQNRQKAFQENVLPKLDAFLGSIRSFREEHEA